MKTHNSFTPTPKYPPTFCLLVLLSWRPFSASYLLRSPPLTPHPHPVLYCFSSFPSISISICTLSPSTTSTTSTIISSSSVITPHPPIYATVSLNQSVTSEWKSETASQMSSASTLDLNHLQTRWEAGTWVGGGAAWSCEIKLQAHFTN